MGTTPFDRWTAPGTGPAPVVARALIDGTLAGRVIALVFVVSVVVFLIALVAL